MLDDKKKALETLEEHEKHLETWLERNDKNQREVQKIQQQLELLRWQREAGKSAPFSSDSPFFRQLTDSATNDLYTTQRALPELPMITPSVLVNSTAGTVS